MRIATFNCENLFARYKFRENPTPTKLDGFTIDELAFDILNEDEKRLTAEAIKKVNADVIGLQEVESLGVIDKFVANYLNSLDYKDKILIDSHDPRGIDVALLSRYPIVSIKTHRDEKSANNSSYLFSRDCLEVQIDVYGKLLFVYINHFKSMAEGREQTVPKRKEQAERVAQIIDQRWEGSNYHGNYVVLGDFNDYPDESTSLGALLSHPCLVNVINLLPENERWTHYYYKGETYSQLDYLMVSKPLVEFNQGCKPEIMRQGLPLRASRYSGPRFAGIGENKPKASDHAPFYIDLNLI